MSNKNILNGGFMKKINMLVVGIASLFTTNNSNILEKYPATYEKDVKKSLSNAWGNVGIALKGAIDKYEKNEKNK